MITRPLHLLIAICAAQVLSMLPFAGWPVLLGVLQGEWGLTNTQAGMIGGVYFVGYVSAVLVLVSVTDMLDPRIVYVFSALATASGAAAFAGLAEGFYSAAAAWALAGIGLAGTYMPGLQILNSRLDAARRVRYVAWYTATFSIGTGTSFFIAGALSDIFAWPWVFALLAAGPLAAAALVFVFIAPLQPTAFQATGRHPLDLRPVLKNRAAIGYIIGYTGHSFELFAFRTWIFFLIVLVAEDNGLQLSSSNAAVIAGTFSFIGMASSVFGAWLALRLGRDRVLTVIMAASVVTGLTAGGASLVSFAVFAVVACLYNILIMLDSGALTAGVVEVSKEGARGATLAAHSFFGFLGAAAGPSAVGLMLDLGGGQTTYAGWLLAFAMMAAGSAAALLGRVAMNRLNNR
ncbi:MAG: MFS transporter [Hyphomicrobiales bacterium]|nr:MFS transporter [Hyphomicrobiales bacterium]